MSATFFFPEKGKQPEKKREKRGEGEKEQENFI